VSVLSWRVAALLPALALAAGCGLSLELDPTPPSLAPAAMDGSVRDGGVRRRDGSSFDAEAPADDAGSATDATASSDTGGATDAAAPPDGASDMDADVSDASIAPGDAGAPECGPASRACVPGIAGMFSEPGGCIATGTASVSISWIGLDAFEGRRVLVAIVRAGDGALLALLHTSVVGGTASVTYDGIEVCHVHVAEAYIDVGMDGVCGDRLLALRNAFFSSDGVPLRLTFTSTPGPSGGIACPCFPIPGNLDGNDCLDANDVCLLESVTRTGSTADPRADVNGDGAIDSTDVVLLMALVDAAGGSLCGACTSPGCS